MKKSKATGLWTVYKIYGSQWHESRRGLSFFSAMALSRVLAELNPGVCFKVQ